MQSLFSALLLLAPLTVIATPVADPNPNAPTPVAEVESPVAVRPRSPAEIFGRSNQYCAIVSNDGTVNCRAGPGTGYDVVATVNDGDIYLFHCYKSGTCYQGNCTWDKLIWGTSSYCYVNGYYTDNHCTAAKLGAC